MPSRGLAFFDMVGADGDDDSHRPPDPSSGTWCLVKAGQQREACGSGQKSCLRIPDEFAVEGCAFDVGVRCLDGFRRIPGIEVGIPSNDVVNGKLYRRRRQLKMGFPMGVPFVIESNLTPEYVEQGFCMVLKTRWSQLLTTRARLEEYAPGWLCGDFPDQSVRTAYEIFLFPCLLSRKRFLRHVGRSDRL